MPFNINDFRSEILNHGVLHGNRFIVTFGSILGLERGGQGSIQKRLSLRAEAIRMPGMVFASADSVAPMAGYGPIEHIPYGVIFDDVPITFLTDGHTEVYKFFYDWTNLIVNYRAQGQRFKNLSSTGTNPYQVAYKDEYVTDITIKVYEPHQDPTTGKDYIAKVTLYRAHPKLMPTFDLAWEEVNQAVKFTVPFAYTDFSIDFKYGYSSNS